MATERISLDGEWCLRWCDVGEGEDAGWQASGVAEEGSIPARVPGMTHLDLYAAGKIPDPLVGRNAEELEWMEEKDWWYSRTFELAEDQIGEPVEIVFEGLDCFADTWVNGRQVGSSRNALVEWRGDIADSVKAGENLVVVRLDTGLRWAVKQDLSRLLVTSGRTDREKARAYLRHSQFSFGWDWAARLVTAGIWKPVRVEVHRDVALRDVCVRTRLGPEGEAVLTVLAELEVFGDAERDVVLEFSLGDAGGTSLRYTLAPGFNLVTHEFSVTDPILWWPCGLGEPHLYDFECRAVDRESGHELAAAGFPIGVREIQIAQEPLPGDEGQSFTFVVNGVPTFAKGANWVPADSLLSRVTPDRYETLIGEARGANFNMLRVWGGGTYEADAFWEACDRLGIMVWLDFQFACAMIPDDDPAFRAEVEREAELVVRRLRNHPSLALWCGNNENQAIYRGESGADQAFYGWKTYHEILPRACAQLDPTRYYWPSSPYGGPRHGDSDIGDTHSWQVSLMGDAPGGLCDYRHYRHDRSKFASEYGFLAPPVRATLEQGLPRDEICVGSPSWQFHANRFETGIPVGGAPSVFEQAFEKLFKRSKDEMELDAFIRLTQAWQAEAYRCSLSHFRRRKFLTSGTLFWMYNDCWVASSGWTIIDYYLRRKPSYYMVRRVFAPEMLSFAEDEGGLSLWLVNDHVHAVDGVLEYGCGSFSQATTQVLGRANYVVPGNRSHRLLALPLSDLVPEQAADRFYWARWLRNGELLSWQHHWLAPWGDVSLADPALKWQVSTGADGEHVLDLSAERYAWMVELGPADELDAEDNYFDLAPGQSRTLRVCGPEEAVKQLTVRCGNDLLQKHP
jgi:beta-mannosidase